MKYRMKLLLATLLIVALGLQLAAAAQKSFWEDETWTATIIRTSLDNIIQAAAHDVHPPLYFLTLALWGRIFGYTELALRSFSIVFVAMTFALTFKLAFEMLGGRTAFIAVALLALSPFFLMYGHNARYYAMSAVLSLVVALSTYKYQVSRRLIFVTTYVVGSAILLYIVYTASAVVLSCCIWGLMQWKKQNNPRSILVIWLLAQGIVVLLYLPWLHVLTSTARTQISMSAVSSSLIVEIIKRVTYLSFVFSVGETLSALNPLALIGLSITIVIGVLGVANNRSSTNSWLILLLTVVESYNIIISIITIYPQSAFQALPNRTFYVFPFFVMWLASGISRMKTKNALMISSVLFVVYGVGIFDYFTYRQYLKPHLAVPWRTILNTIQAEAHQNSVVICNQADTTCPYYVARYGFEPYSPQNWPTLAQQRHSEVWWINSNLGAQIYDKNSEAEILQEIKKKYRTAMVANYAPQDPSIRWLKMTLLNQRDDYEYRVNVFKFSDPVEP